MFDNICKYLVQSYPEDFATWLLGEAVPLSQLEPSELLLEPIRADALLLLAAEELVLHMEFQTAPDPSMPFRMLDYRTRVYRRYPAKAMRQVVVYLKPSTSALVYESAFEIPGTRHVFEVVRLWEQPAEVFLHSPGLMPLAVLGQTSDRESMLRSTAAVIETLPQGQRGAVAASTAVLAGLVLNQETIGQILRRDVMRESVIYQEILAEGRAEGRVEGRTEGERALVMRLLTRRLGILSPEMHQRIEALELTQLEALGEALLDFQSPEDLQAWLVQLG
ncbi:Rpn family recombination-promoting nuclease/putative transposase [Synechococcales cyanobacterium C]|uniref:Rpn family recombination-promoting nuclease/putative transposase n=1 Tax=Petrachloros mirabilis ULC683 TaxID=2781853 RepID=A0A8K2A9G8_9CYAN|nr:Rpn family recombination-promoting nuclease/putative transposase [Petrachloros mirabilis]NCJ08185.1 Rpn family recombination-promoting nuclease/putative transposase [Petrachloros mirabilis ULC683]